MVTVLAPPAFADSDVYLAWSQYLALIDSAWWRWSRGRRPCADCSKSSPSVLSQPARIGSIQPNRDTSPGQLASDEGSGKPAGWPSPERSRRVLDACKSR